jgi:pimeloyl-ACP methyl ester carboxylesterase
MGMAKQFGDTGLIKKMEGFGEPPYSGKGMLKKYSSFLGKYETYKRKETNYLQNKEYEKNESLSMFFFREYGTIDKINAVRGLIDTFQAMYPQIQDLNFVEQAPRLEVPVYFLIGRHDYTSQFIEEYYDVLSAPKKELIWFENSAHGNIWSEAELFHEILLEKILPETLL